jgi:GNAT superfamily N-acetyltransferase
MNWTPRIATEADIPALEELIPLSARGLLPAYYPGASIEAALGPAFGVDEKLIRDGTYFVVEDGGRIVGCGGWSRRFAVCGGYRERPDDDAKLDPARDPARIRAFFIHPEWARRGIGHCLLSACEAAIAEAGFHTVMMVATLGGEPLYAAHGYIVEERYDSPLPCGLELPVVRMTKSL